MILSLLFSGCGLRFQTQSVTPAPETAAPETAVPEVPAAAPAAPTEEPAAETQPLPTEEVRPEPTTPASAPSKRGSLDRDGGHSAPPASGSPDDESVFAALAGDYTLLRWELEGAVCENDGRPGQLTIGADGVTEYAEFDPDGNCSIHEPNMQALLREGPFMLGSEPWYLEFEHVQCNCRYYLAPAAEADQVLFYREVFFYGEEGEESVLTVFTFAKKTAGEAAAGEDLLGDLRGFWKAYSWRSFQPRELPDGVSVSCTLDLYGNGKADFCLIAGEGAYESIGMSAEKRVGNVVEELTDNWFLEFIDDDAGRSIRIQSTGEILFVQELYREGMGVSEVFFAMMERCFPGDGLPDGPRGVVNECTSNDLLVMTRYAPTEWESFAPVHSVDDTGEWILLTAVRDGTYVSLYDGIPTLEDGVITAWTAAGLAGEYDLDAGESVLVRVDLPEGIPNRYLEISRFGSRVEYGLGYDGTGETHCEIVQRSRVIE